MKTEKLQKIRSKCVELLALAQKRTPGEWHHRADCRGHDANSRQVFKTQSPDFSIQGDLRNAAFIAACAGPAEAGWRSTIAAIDLCSDSPTYYANIADSILSAWPDELTYTHVAPNLGIGGEEQTL